MFRTILVPLDGSAFAEHAIPLAVSLAKRAGATVRFLRVVPPLEDYFFMPPLLSDPLDQKLRQVHRGDALAYLEGVVHRLKDHGPVECDVVEEDEDLCGTICASVVKTGADLIIMTSHGRGSVARFWLGSIADTLVRTAPVPVLLTRPPELPATVDLQQPVRLQHFLLALGGNTIAERIVEPALAIGRMVTAEYTLVRVVRPAYPLVNLIAGTGDAGPATKLDEQNCLKAEEYLRGVAARLRAEGAKVQTRVHLAEQPAAAILREAALVGADLIALETHGRGMSRLLIGSVADKVVRGSTLPVLVCRLPHQLS